MEDLIVRINGKEHKVKIEETEGGKIKVYCEGEVYEVETKSDIQPAIREDITKKESKVGKKVVTAPLPGIISEIKVRKGGKVKENQPLIKLIAMKMENEVVSPVEGVVKEIKVKKNSNVNKGDVLIVLE
jgi:biotin carboxyl carrier protein